MAKKVLVVDDENDLAAELQRWLAEEGYTVLLAYNGIDALTKAKAEKPDLIITDVLMPGITGLQLIEELESVENDRGRIPVIVMSARQSTEEVFEKRAGLEFVLKPFKCDDMLAIVHRLLD